MATWVQLPDLYETTSHSKIYRSQEPRPLCHSILLVWLLYLAEHTLKMVLPQYSKPKSLEHTSRVNMPKFCRARHRSFSLPNLKIYLLQSQVPRSQFSKNQLRHQLQAVDQFQRSQSKISISHPGITGLQLGVMQRNIKQLQLEGRKWKNQNSLILSLYSFIIFYICI